MKEISEEKKQVLAAVDAGIKKLHTLDERITLYEVSHPLAVFIKDHNSTINNNNL